MPQKPRELQLYRLKSVRSKGNIEGLADESKVQYYVLITATHAHGREED